MQLAAAQAELLAERVSGVLDARLRRESTRPLIVAFSGGGDSLALLLIAASWARAAGRRLLAFTVDHGLNPESPVWTLRCAQQAAALGVPFRALTWEGPKPVTGVPAAARRARHALLAEAARAAGCRVMLMGHTADDVLEARRMLVLGSSTPEPRAWGPSPAWPEGRGLFLARPLLEVSRAELRAWLAARGQSWIDDPANADPRYARARARVSDIAAPAPPALDAAGLRHLASGCQTLACGGLEISRAALRAAPARTAARFVAAASLSAAGTSRPAAGERTRALTARLRSAEVLVATLVGARIEAEPDVVRFLREAGEIERGGLEPLRLGADERRIWDGRFEVAAQRPIRVRALRGSAQLLDAAQRRALLAIPAGARGGLPLVEGEGSPLLGAVAGVAVRALTGERLQAACGAIDREPY